MGDDIVKKKMIVLIAFIYIASMLFCGDGVGKKFVEEKFPHLTYSDKECDDSKKKELRIVEDEDTAGGILSYEELAAMENENASVRNNMLPDTDQLAFVDEAEKNGELAELKEQQNVKMPQVDMSFDNLVKNYYQVDKTTYIGADELCEEVLLGRDMSIEKSGNGPDILIYHTHSQEGYSDSIDTSETETVVGVGDRLESLLREKYGYNVLHHKGQYDVNDRDHAYSNSLPEITEIIEKNPSIKVVIDLHRDGVNENLHFVTDINGKATAKVMLFNGISYSNNQGDIDYLYNPYLKENLALTYQMYLLGKTYYPDFFRCIYIEAYRYNLHLCKRSMLIEAGAQTNSFAEVINAMEPLAELIARELIGTPEAGTYIR